MDSSSSPSLDTLPNPSFSQSPPASPNAASLAVQPTLGNVRSMESVVLTAQDLRQRLNEEQRQNGSLESQIEVVDRDIAIATATATFLRRKRASNLDPLDKSIEQMKTALAELLAQINTIDCTIEKEEALVQTFTAAKRAQQLSYVERFELRLENDADRALADAVAAEIEAEQAAAALPAIDCASPSPSSPRLRSQGSTMAATLRPDESVRSRTPGDGRSRGRSTRRSRAGSSLTLEAEKPPRRQRSRTRGPMQSPRRASRGDAAADSPNISVSEASTRLHLDDLASVEATSPGRAEPATPMRDSTESAAVVTPVIAPRGLVLTIPSDGAAAKLAFESTSATTSPSNISPELLTPVSTQPPTTTNAAANFDATLAVCQGLAVRDCIVRYEAGVAESAYRALPPLDDADATPVVERRTRLPRFQQERAKASAASAAVAEARRELEELELGFREGARARLEQAARCRIASSPLRLGPCERDVVDEEVSAAAAAVESKALLLTAPPQLAGTSPCDDDGLPSLVRRASVGSSSARSDCTDAVQPADRAPPETARTAKWQGGDPTATATRSASARSRRAFVERVVDKDARSTALGLNPRPPPVAANLPHAAWPRRGGLERPVAQTAGLRARYGAAASRSLDSRAASVI